MATGSAVCSVAACAEAAIARTRLVEGGLAIRLQRQVELVERDDVRATTCGGRARGTSGCTYSSWRSASYCSTALGSRTPSSSGLRALRAPRPRPESLRSPLSAQHERAGSGLSREARARRAEPDALRVGGAALLTDPRPLRRRQPPRGPKRCPHDTRFDPTTARHAACSTHTLEVGQRARFPEKTAAQPSLPGGVVSRARPRALPRAYGVVEKQDIDSAVRLPKATVLR